MLGYCTYGDKDENDKLVASEVIVFMITGLRQNFRIPIAYHFVRPLDVTKKKQLLLEVISKIENAGIILVNVTSASHE